MCLWDSLPEGLPPERSIGHPIVLESGAKPPFQHPYRMSPTELTEARSQIADFLDRGHAQKSASPFSSPVVFIQKKDGPVSSLLCACVLTIVS